MDWDKYIPKSERSNTLIYLDDHQGFVRCLQAAQLGFKYMFVDDNYPNQEQAPKQVFLEETEKSTKLRSILETYFEYPPVSFKSHPADYLKISKPPLVTTEKELTIYKLNYDPEKHHEYVFPSLLVFKDSVLFQKHV